MINHALFTCLPGPTVMGPHVFLFENIWKNLDYLFCDPYFDGIHMSFLMVFYGLCDTYGML